MSGEALAGRTILITGASSGVGKHLSLMIAKEGANVIGCARRAEMLEDLVEEIRAEGGKAAAVPCDVTIAGSLENAFASAESRFGTVDGVVVNAGINHAGPFAAASVEEIDAVLSVNLRGALLTAREGGKRMLAAARSGAERPWRVLFVASILGLRPIPGAATYSATKAGVVMLAKALALEWARHGISVNAICPGYMPTDIVEDWFASEGGKRQLEGWPRRQLMPVDRLDGMVRLLLGEGGESISGTAVTIDDGQSLS